MKTLGKYEKLDVLGNGTSGIVYLAKDTLLNRQVALKEVSVDAGDVRRFLEEARVIDRLRHPNIVRIHGVDRIDDKIIIDMEYVRGLNLQQLLKAEGAQTVERALDITDQTLDALAYAHSQQTVHRDIKPANILIGRDGVVKLVDFGLAEILATNAYAGGAGTYAYMAPEDFASEDRSDHQSDLWAVGVTLYEMLTLTRPFRVARVKDPFAWKRALENDDAIPLSEELPEASPALTAVLNRALSKEKRKRYPTADAFRDDILALRAGRALPAETLAFANLSVSSRIAQDELATVHSQPRWGLRRETSGKIESETNGVPGVVVAEVNRSPLRNHFAALPETNVVTNPLPFATQEREGDYSTTAQTVPKTGQMSVEPVTLDFGQIRFGESRELKLRVRVFGDGVKGRVIGSVQKSADWLRVSPISFDRLKQAVTVTVNTGQTNGVGFFQDSIAITTEHGILSVPVKVRVTKPRPSFIKTALWFVPLFFTTLLPVFALLSHSGENNAWLASPVALASALLSWMLLLVTIAADTGFVERATCSVIITAMCLILGVSERSASAHSIHTVQYLAMVAVVLGASILLQMMSLKSWKFWGFALLGLSVLVSDALFRAAH